MIVIDCSLIMASILPDESGAAAEKILDDLARGLDEAVVPAHFYLECSNVLATALRRKRITAAVLGAYLDTLLALPLDTDTACLSAAGTRDIMLFATAHRLTAYDAAYLELAIRSGCPLASLDSSLRKAAETRGVSLL